MARDTPENPQQAERRAQNRARAKSIFEGLAAAFNPRIQAQQRSQELERERLTQQQERFVSTQQQQIDVLTATSLRDTLRLPGLSDEVRAEIQGALRTMGPAQTPGTFAPLAATPPTTPQPKFQKVGNSLVLLPETRGGKPVEVFTAEDVKDTTPFGKGLEGRSMAILIRNATLNRELTQQEQLEEQGARQFLTTERLVVGPQGERMTFTPGLPEFARQPRAVTAPSTEGTTPTPAGGTITEVLTRPALTKQDKLKIATGRDLINQAADILNEAKNAGSPVTGILGFAKVKGGGLARQAGVPINPNAERLSRVLKRLQGILGPLLLNEKRLTDTERKRLAEIVGDVNAADDDVALRDALVDIVTFLDDLETRGQ